MTEFELGQKVRYTNTLHRASGVIPSAESRRGRIERRKEWAHYGWADNEAFRGNPLYNGVGIVTALRTVSNGTADYSGDVTSYKVEETFPVVEITYHLRRKPVICRLEDVWPEA